MKTPVPVESASAKIEEKIEDFGDWRGEVLSGSGWGRRSNIGRLEVSHLL